MSSALYPPARPRSIGEVLDLAFRIFHATLLRCLPFGVLAMVASQLQNIYDIAMRHPLHQFGGGDPLWWVVYGVGAFLAVTCVNIILIRQGATVAGVRPVNRSVSDGLARAPAAIAVLLILLAAILVCFVPVAAILLLGMRQQYLTWAIIALSVPAIYIAILVSCAWTSLVIGRKGIIASVRYSVHLVRGNWWRTLVVYLVTISLLGVLVVSAGVIATVLIPFVSGGDLAVASAASAVMVAVLGAAYWPFFTSVALALYGDLEVRKEAADREHPIAGAVAG